FGYGVVLLVCWGLALRLTFRSNGGRTVSKLIFDAEQAVSFTAVGMFVFVVGSSALLGIRWTSTICGIAFGLGLLGTVDLVVYAALASDHLISTNVASWIETLSYNCAVGVFASYFLLRRQEDQVPGTMSPELLQWAESVKGSEFKCCRS